MAIWKSGSATSWMLKKLINARGGLHNRVTHKMLVSPFCLEETEQYFQSKGFNYERPEIIDCYMAVGGVAYYLSLFSKDKSVAEKTDEFNKLYDSLFKKAENHIAVINALSNNRKGMTRLELISKAKLPNNGNSSKDEIIHGRKNGSADFTSISPSTKQKRVTSLQLADFW